MARRLVVGLLLGIAGIGAVASVSAGERHGGWGGPPWGMHGGMHGGWFARWSALSPEDRAAFRDARIAGLHAGLKLNPDQEKLWPPVETALRDLAKQREARMQAWSERREQAQDNPPEALRGMADAATARGEALRKLADATAPLYATLDEGQKRRAMILARPMGRGMGPGGWRRHGPEGKPDRDDHDD